jgi:predicted MFS family arabinose efflux permease
VLGPMVGAAFSQGGEWRALFWAFAGQCAIFLAAAVVLLPQDAPPDARPISWAQIVVVLVGVALIGAADLAPGVVSASGLCAASLVAFLWAVRWRPASGVSLFPKGAGDPLSLVGGAYLSYFALSGSAMSFSVYAPALLQKLFGLSPLVAGYSAAIESVGWTVAAISVAGTHVRWHGPIIRAGAAAIVISLAWLALVMRSGPLWTILAAATVLGGGFGLSSGLTGRRVIGSAPEAEREVTSAGLNSVRQVGNAAGACLAGIVANLLGMSHGMTLAAAKSAAVWMFVCSLPVALAGAWGAWRVGGMNETP